VTTGPVSAVSKGLPSGFRLHHVETIGSTNDEAVRLAQEGASSGLIVMADRQTRGRGRLGRSWQSGSGNLHMSILLRPDCRLNAASQLSLLASVVLADVLLEGGPEGLDLTLKWPNDVLIGGAKVAGILLESAGDKTGKLAYVVLGVGLNVAWAPDEMRYRVTSLGAEGFPPRSPSEWLGDYAQSLSIWLDRWQRDGFAVVRAAWRNRSHCLGHPIRLKTDHEEIEGRFIDLTETGALLVEHADRSRSELAAGDITFLDL
jgi:BirA family biotin operon repressor/biotin-[acetyl-CoA-carboxylase] ligase